MRSGGRLCKAAERACPSRRPRRTGDRAGLCAGDRRRTISAVLTGPGLGRDDEARTPRRSARTEAADNTRRRCARPASTARCSLKGADVTKLCVTPHEGELGCAELRRRGGLQARPRRRLRDVTGMTVLAKGPTRSLSGDGMTSFSSADRAGFRLRAWRCARRYRGVTTRTARQPCARGKRSGLAAPRGRARGGPAFSRVILRAR